MEQRQPKRFALVNVLAQRAAIYEGTGPIVLIEIKSDGEAAITEPVPSGLHMGMWLQPADAVEWEAGEPPYTALVTELRKLGTLHSLAFSLTTVLDGTCTADLRQMAAEELEQKLQSSRGQEVAEEFRQLVVENEIPSDASTRDAPFMGKSREIFNEAIGKWGHRPRDG